ncbi:uncharacterized protein ATC70_001638 [Mucor velutinosus]|uniref:Uncharacterized protein n=1 Tax=Mucor velutinosus TaxID=708070 RepID=A0AAN7I2C9_9FUNG|nr:hypothetical protein ATC70_001638 [Mucor velutinosus]
MMKHIKYKSLNPSDIALVDLTNQHLLFSKEDWNQIKALLSTSPTNNDLIESWPALRKIDKIFKNPRDAEECYWNSKNYQKKALKFNEKMGYELISVIVDKMIKHKSIFTISKPTPSEADIMIKIWADLFEVLFYNTEVYIRWGEKGLDTGNDDHTIFKLDAKLVLLYDGAEYPISSVEFAPYAGPRKIKTDRSKLLVEAKTIYDKVMGLNVNEGNAALLKIVNVQIMGLEAHVMSVNTADDYLYIASSIDSYMLPSTVSQLKKHSKTIIGHLFDLKHYALNTTDIIKQTLNDKKKAKKSMKRKIQEEIDYDKVAPSLKANLVPTWRYKAKSED